MNEHCPLLLVDDDPGFRRVYRKLLSNCGYDVTEAKDAPSAQAAFKSAVFDVVVLDLMLPPSGQPEEGARLAEQFVQQNPLSKIVVVSGTGDNELALALVRTGVYDFITKPVDPDVLLAVLSRARARLALERRVSELELSLVSAAQSNYGLLGSSQAFLEAQSLCERVAPTQVPVLLTGETGTGKEVFARYLHSHSAQRDGPFLPINCSALPATLLESTLFGHKKGSFSGAVKDAPGLFVQADGGTLFLDELGDMAPDLQVKLLRTLESGEVLPVGATQPEHVDVRLVSATHRPLAELLREGRFREDLYYRLCGVEIVLPRLQDRSGDVSLLANHFLNQARTLVPSSTRVELSGEALRSLEAYSWPGNLRQLRHEMQRALVMAAGQSQILVEHLSVALSQSRASAVGSEQGGTLEQQIEALERQEISRMLEKTEGNKSKAAEGLGLSRQGLLNKIARYGL